MVETLLLCADVLLLVGAHSTSTVGGPSSSVPVATTKAQDSSSNVGTAIGIGVALALVITAIAVVFFTLRFKKETKVAVVSMSRKENANATDRQTLTSIKTKSDMYYLSKEEDGTHNAKSPVSRTTTHGSEAELPDDVEFSEKGLLGKNSTQQWRMMQEIMDMDDEHKLPIGRPAPDKGRVTLAKDGHDVWDIGQSSTEDECEKI